ncbi:transcriptional regulator, IclR family, C-terminal domain protein [Bordetella bronchiseptica 99-R-0433]|nr:transcriptional regulator, IclR family, C-terminal domain protein [Bordetella bronchiseptica 99-R-0433]
MCFANGMLPRLPDSSPAAQSRRPTVAPFARALSVLASFSPGDQWLSNSEFVARTGLPASTVTRMTSTLVTLGYLHCAPDTRRFCLSSSVLALGYGAAVDAEIHRPTNQLMRVFAEHHQVNVQLSCRDRLDLVVMDSCLTDALPALLQPGVGTRLGMASSAAGWALLACLPEAERDYLLRARPHAPAESKSDWNPMRRHANEAILQVRKDGFCVALGESGHPMTMVAAPIRRPGLAPLAVSCMGPATRIGRARSTRELGPALVRMVEEIQRVWNTS